MIAIADPTCAFLTTKLTPLQRVDAVKQYAKPIKTIENHGAHPSFSDVQRRVTLAATVIMVAVTKNVSLLPM